MDLISTFFNVDVFVRALPLLMSGLTTTLTLGITSILAGMILGQLGFALVVLAVGSVVTVAQRFHSVLRQAGVT